VKKNPLKTILNLLLTLCLSVTTILQNNITPANAAPSTLIVHDGESIQEAINNASSGDIIYVLSGTYQENIVINKSITLIGENRENTIIDGGGIGNVISIQASDVNISGFTIQNGDPRKGCGIYAERTRNVVISNNNIKTNYVGIQMVFSSWNRMHENTISGNYIGLQLIYSGGNAIYRNVVSNNYYGIDFFYYSADNVIHENILSGNDWSISCSWYSNNNVFYHNNFINNNYNVYIEKTKNTWSFSGEGNYWDDYSGKDLNKDGIGDFPYNITEGNVDYYPLMGMFYKFIVHFGGNIHDVAIISNSAILDFTFKTVAEMKARVILFNASSDGGSICFSRVGIPKRLMANIHAVLINEEEANVTLLNVGDVENFYLYIEHFGNCSVKIVYSELLDWYHQLLCDYSDMLERYRGLNESYSVLLGSYYQLLSNYSDLLDKYRGLNESYSELVELSERFLEFNASVNVLAEKLDALNATLYNLLKDYGKLQDEFNDVSSSYQNQAQNFRSLIYIFIGATAIFILTTIYFSKKAHEKVAESKVGTANQ